MIPPLQHGEAREGWLFVLTHYREADRIACGKGFSVGYQQDINTLASQYTPDVQETKNFPTCRFFLRVRRQEPKKILVQLHRKGRKKYETKEIHTGQRADLEPT